jgi:mitogen-activated protein kinase kinase
MTASSTPLGPLGSVNAARRPVAPTTSSLAGPRGGGLPEDMQAKMRAFHLSRQGAPPAAGSRNQAFTPAGTLPQSTNHGGSNSVSGGLNGSIPPSGPTPPSGSLAGGLQLSSNGRPHQPNWTSAPQVPGVKGPKPSLGARRGLKLPGGLPGTSSPVPHTSTPGSNEPLGNRSKSGDPCDAPSSSQPESGSLFNKFSTFVDTKTGSLKFDGKAVIHGKGIDFSSGSSFNISLDEVDTLEELGKGNYGTVYKVRHRRPQVRRPGLGLKGNKAPPSLANSTSSTASPETPEASSESTVDTLESPNSSRPKSGTTGIIMAMKEIRLELDEAKFAAIIMELDVLHRCTSPFIVDFYGAFFQEGAVYMCMEFMDGGSIDKLYGDGIPEGVLRKVTLSTIMGLKNLKEDHNIIHRDVKPTNILVNTRGQVKICDFGVSGNLVASIAKTNIGCQSYMAPERIANGGVSQAGAAGGSYSVQSDVWSLGLSIIECAMGRYPYPPETYNNIFSQLNVSTWS